MQGRIDRSSKRYDLRHHSSVYGEGQEFPHDVAFLLGARRIAAVAGSHDLPGSVHIGVNDFGRLSGRLVVRAHRAARFAYKRPVRQFEIRPPVRIVQDAEQRPFRLVNFHLAFPLGAAPIRGGGQQQISLRIFHFPVDVAVLIEQVEQAALLVDLRHPCKDRSLCVFVFHVQAVRVGVFNETRCQKRVVLPETCCTAEKVFSYFPIRRTLAESCFERFDLAAGIYEAGVEWKIQELKMRTKRRYETDRGNAMQLRKISVYGSAPQFPGTGLLLLTLLLLSAGCHRSQASAGLELQSEDYSAARKHFQTHLVQHGPAPQQGEPLHPPAGAEQVEYDPALHLQAWITPPPANGQVAGGKRPAVLFLHGGFAIGSDDWEMARPYQQAGYMVMMPILRGENGQQGEYSMFYNEVEDVVVAAEYLAKRPSVDAKHLYLVGHSVGGTLTLLAAMTSSRFRAAASFSGAPDAIAWSRGQQELIVFDSIKAREFQMRSPLAFATSFKCPVRIYCGSAEPLFIEASQQTSARAKKKGLDVEAVRVSGDHFSAVPEEIQQSLLFFQAH